MAAAALEKARRAEPATAPTAQKPRAVEVFVRLEEAADPAHRFALRCTLPARWVGARPLRTLLDTFFDAYERARPEAPHDRTSAALLGDASRKKLALDAPLALDLEIEKTLWVRTADDPHFFGPAKTNTALIRYVPRILTRTSRAEMREQHERDVTKRAQRILDLFAVPAEAATVDQCRRIIRDGGGGEGAAESMSTRRVDLGTLRDRGDDGRYAEASAQAWNRLQGFLPEDVVVGGFIPIKGEAKVVASLYGKRWVGRPRFCGAPCGDPAVIGRVLGVLHQCAHTYALHTNACAAMELRPRPFAETFEKDCAWASSKLVDTDVAATYAKAMEQVPMIVRNLPPQWVHASYAPSQCRQHLKTHRLRVDGCEGGREHVRLWDLYHLFVWDYSKRGLDAGTLAFPVALRAYFKETMPPTRHEAALLQPVFLLRTGFLIAEVQDEISKVDADPDLVLRARKAGVDAVSFRGVGAPPLLGRVERLQQLRRRQRSLVRVWRTIIEKADWLRQTFEDAGPKLLEAGATLKLLPPSSSVVIVGKTRREEDALVAARTAALGGGFWARVRAGREVRDRATVGCTPSASNDTLVDVLEGRLSDGREVAPLKELARGLKAGSRKVAVKRADGAVGGVVLALRRDARRAANVQRLCATMPRLVVQTAVDGLVEGDLEGHLRAHAGEPRIHFEMWAARASEDGHDALRPRRGEVARAASHCAAWRRALEADVDHLLVLEDGVEVAPDLADAVALLLAEVPAYDVLYLLVPPRYRAVAGAGRVVEASCPVLSAYVVSKRACGKLLDLCRGGLDRPLGAAVAAADFVTFAAREPPVAEAGMASTIVGTPEFCPLLEEE